MAIFAKMLSPQAHADFARAGSVVVTATFDSSQPNTVGTNLTSNYCDEDHGSYLTTAGTVAGIYDFSVNGYAQPSTGSSPLTLGQAETALGNIGDVFRAVCVDFTHNVYFGQQATWQIENLTDIDGCINGVGISCAQANALSYLWWHDASVATPDSAATFQLAAWDLVYNGGGTYSSKTGARAPTVSYTGPANDDGDACAAAKLAATAWQNNSTSAGPVYALVSTVAQQMIPGQGTQSFIFADVPTVQTDLRQSATPVPLPSAVGMGLSMMGLLSASSLLRNRLRRRTVRSARSPRFRVEPNGGRFDASTTWMKG